MLQVTAGPSAPSACDLLDEQFTSASRGVEAVLPLLEEWNALKDTTRRTTNELASALLSRLLQQAHTLVHYCRSSSAPVDESALAHFADCENNPQARVAFAEALEQEEALVGQGLEAQFPLAELQASLASLLPALGRLRDKLVTLERFVVSQDADVLAYKLHANLETKLRDMYANFAEQRKKVGRQIRRLLQRRDALEDSDSDIELDGENDIQQLNQAIEIAKQENRKMLSSHQRDWSELMGSCWQTRPELRLRHWCKLQPWAQLDDKARAKAEKKRSGTPGSRSVQAETEFHLQPWVEHMLQFLNTHGLERPELSLDDYTLNEEGFDVVSRAGANHPVRMARNPAGAVVALKRFTVAARDVAALRKVSPLRGGCICFIPPAMCARGECNCVV